MAKSDEWKRVNDDGTITIKSCTWSPPGCHPVGCGLLLHVKDGNLLKVEGDEDHPIYGGRLNCKMLGPGGVREPSRPHRVPHEARP